MNLTKEDRRLLIKLQTNTGEPIPVRKILELKARHLTSLPVLIGKIPELTLLSKIQKNEGGFAELHADPPNKKCQYWRIWVTGCSTQYEHITKTWHDGLKTGVYAEQGDVIKLTSFVNGGEHSAVLDLS